MNIKPLGPYVIVKPVKPETMSAGGIHLPEVRRAHMDNTALVGDVVGVGDGHRFGDERIPLHVFRGERVLYGAHLGEEITIDGEKYQKLHELHILAIVEP